MRNIDNFIYLGITNPTYEAEGTIDHFTQITSSNSDLQMLLDNILKTSQSEEILAAATDNVIEFMNKSFEGAYLVKDGGVCIIYICRLLFADLYAALSL